MVHFGNILSGSPAAVADNLGGEGLEEDPLCHLGQPWPQHEPKVVLALLQFGISLEEGNSSSI